MTHRPCNARRRDLNMPYWKLGEQEPNTIVLNEDEDEQLLCTGYQSTTCRDVLYHLLCLLFLGVPYWIFYVRKDWKAKWKKSACLLSKADTVILKDTHGHCHVEFVIKDDVSEVTDEHLEQFIAREESPSTEGSPLTHAYIPVKKYIRYFVHRHVKFIWKASSGVFERLRGLQTDTTILDLLKMEGYTKEEQALRMEIYGKNSIEVEVKSYWKLLFEEVLNPFYVFQIYSVILWSLDDYAFYASCIFFISAVSIIVTLYETRKQSEALHDMVSSTVSATIDVRRKNGDIDSVHPTEVVPGDVIVIPPHGCVMACDAVLTVGTCIVNESMLTGESVPVTKTALAHNEELEIYSSEKHKRHTIFSGTKVIQTRYYGDNKVLAVVVHTSFETSKGELVRSILFPQPIGFKFYQDAMRFVLLLFCIASVGMIYCIYVYLKMKKDTSEVILRALDIVTIVVPPALPAAMTVGIVFAQKRLKKNKIFCISPPKINVCGKLKLVAFDKTGTLTEDGLDFWSVVPVQRNEFQGEIRDPSKMAPQDSLVVCMASCHSLTLIEGDLNGDPLDLQMFEATGWELEEPSSDTKRYDLLTPAVVRPKEAVYIRLPMMHLDEPGSDTSKFDAVVPTVVKPVTKSEYVDPKSIDDAIMETDLMRYEVGIVRQLTFTSNLQRMSVITRTLGKSHMDLFCKGAPEKVASLCKDETLPKNFHTLLQQYTLVGFRVLALAHRALDSKLSWHQAQKASRDSLEKDLTFLGLLIMRNALKPESTPVIRTLHEAKIRTVMVTGDNLLTAVSVARDCGLVGVDDQVIIVDAHTQEDNTPAYLEFQYAEAPSQDFLDIQQDGQNENGVIAVDVEKPTYRFATTGKSWAAMRHYFPEMIQKLCVKGTVFARMSPEQKAQLIRELQEVGFTAAMCGDGANDCSALKAAQVGVSLSEAEASVAAPFTSQTPNITCIPLVIKEGRAALVTSFSLFKYMALYSVIQFVSVLILYTYETNIGDTQFLYIDLFIITFLAMFMGYTGPHPKLCAARPSGSLLGLSSVFSLLSQIILTIVVQIAALYYVKTRSWYKPVDAGPDDEVIVCWENLTLFGVSSYQYLIMAFVFSKGPPFRKHFYTNFWLLFTLIGLTGATTFLIMRPPHVIADFFELKTDPIESPHFTFRLIIIGFAGINLVLSVLLDLIADSSALKKFVSCINPKKEPKNKYKLIERELSRSPNWPPIGSKEHSSVVT